MKINICQPQYCYETGQRSNNEDNIYPSPSMATPDDRLFMVCDGMGGHKDGEVASKAVCDAVSAYWKTNDLQTDSAGKLKDAIVSAMDRMDQMVKSSKGDWDMGTTLTLLSIGAESVLAAHVGDSRIYQIRPGTGIIYRSKDHSLVQTWVDAGLLTPAEARNHPKSNIITQVIQPAPSSPVQPEVVILTDFKDGDYFLLCSDGVTEALDDDELVDILCHAGSDVEKIAKIKQACFEKSRDNYSAYLIPMTFRK